ncbi:DUF748 domain-containing protein [Acidovorax sp. SRB_24]|uniref:DUF748 domain-containing protein n=1 Tax=Acidovorax sp. SRB_24 TaxID=1962700 RepID=UPI00145EC42D|nr:DUF748 domain-containing protein [Acidovorax sp. SRB_24]NMM75158.1 hypothetical protein [Acidovorax sp. SRB_24]
MNFLHITSHRWVRRLGWALGCLVLVWAVGWLAVPSLVRSQAQKLASDKLGRPVTIGRVDFVPWTLELSVYDLAVAATDGGSPQLHIQRIYIDAELQSLLRLAPVADAVQIDGLTVRLAQRAPGRYDIDDIVARLQQQADPQAAPPQFALYNIAVHGGSVDFQDETVGRTHVLRGLELQIPFLSNLASQREVKVSPHLAFTLNGSAFDSQAEATPFSESQKAEATIRLSGLDLAPYLPYLPASLPLRLQAGVVDADLRLSFVHAPSAVVKLGGRLQARKVRVTDTLQHELLSFDALAVDVTDLQPLARIARIGAVQLDAPRLAVRKDRAGKINLDWGGAHAANPPSAVASVTPAQADSGAGAAGWQLAVARLAVRGAQVDWQDDSLPAPAKVALRGLELDVSSVALPWSKPLRFSGQTQVAEGGAGPTDARVVFEGEATDRQAKVAASVRALPLALAAPYLGQWMAPRLQGALDADLGVAWNGPAVVAHVARLTLDGVALACAPRSSCAAGGPLPAGMAMRAKDSLAEFPRLQIADAQVDVARRTVRVGQLALTQPRLRLERGADHRWMFEHWQAAHPAAQGARHPQTAAVQGAPWSVQLADVSVDGGALAFRDAAQATPVAFQLSSLQMRLKDFAPLAQSAPPSALRLSARLGAGRADPGRVEYEGTLGLAPLTAQGRVLATHVPLHAFEPYFAESLNVAIRRADGSFKGQVHYAQSGAGPRITVRGDAALDEVRVRMAQAAAATEARASTARGLGAGDDELLNWKSLSVRGLQVALVPGRPTTVDVRETALSDFFARVIVQENGRLNLQELVKKPSSAESARGAAAAAPDGRGAEPVVRIGPLKLTGGQVHFVDHFIKPNYSADLSDLSGQLSAFSSVKPSGTSAPAMADLELRGRAEGTASLEIVGKLNPLVDPLALDIQGHMRDLELPPLSPYTIKYAGHGIERGKLSMDVAYQVLPNGQLTASNKLVLNQLTFGEPVEGAPASLPVRLAVALLADRNGVIDLDLPISGSLNDPAFRLGPVIFKAIGNLILKAVTAPFSLLAHALGGGGGESPSAVAFAPGSAHLDDSARQALDKVARALTDRPSLTMTVVGEASAEMERDAWKRERLQQALLAQKRRAAQRTGQAAETVAAVEPQEYPALLKELYRRADMRKPRNLVGMAKDLPQAEMEAMLLDSMAVPDDAMRELALARGVAVRDYLASRQLPLDRLFLGAAKTLPPTPQWTPRAELTLALH